MERLIKLLLFFTLTFLLFFIVLSFRAAYAQLAVETTGEVADKPNLSDLAETTGQDQVDTTGQPKPPGMNEIIAPIEENVENTQIRVPITENTRLEVPGGNPRVRTYNPTRVPGTLTGNEPSMEPVIQITTTFGPPDEDTPVPEDEVAEETATNLER